MANINVDVMLKDWKVRYDKTQNAPIIYGEYGIIMGKQEIASESFNSEYGGSKIAFTTDAMEKVKAAEAIILSEIEKMFNGGEVIKKSDSSPF